MNSKNTKKDEFFQEENPENGNPNPGTESQEDTPEQSENQETEVTAETQLEEVQKQLDDMKDKYLRLSAEFDNFRKRTMKEKAELILNGGEKTVLSILPVLDDMERALATIEKANDIESVREGVELIYQKFLKTLSQNGVKQIETEGKELDTDFHEAIAIVPASSEEQKGKIMDCMQKGYQLNDKVIRHAKVVVGE